MDLEIFDQTTAQLPNEQLEMVRDLLQYAAKELSLSENTEMARKTENECSLLDILEENPDEKYFLSQEQTDKLLGRL